MESVNTVPDLEIRPATEKDAALILSFIKELAEYERLSHEVVATEEILRETLFDNSFGTEVVIAYLKETPVGFALYFHNYSTFLGRSGIYLEDLYVRPDYRGKGVGRELLMHVAQVARERDCGRLEWSVLDWNEPAIKFYRKLGANPLDEWTTFRVTGEALDRLAGES